MSGQDYCYVVLHIAAGSGRHNIVTTFPTRYQAEKFVEIENRDDLYIQRWRHGDRQGHFVE